MVGTILWALIGGAIIGLLGKWVAPGDRDVPLWATVLCGVGGVFLGNWLYVDVFNFRESTARPRLVAPHLADRGRRDPGGRRGQRPREAQAA